MTSQLKARSWSLEQDRLAIAIAHLSNIEQSSFLHRLRKKLLW